MSGVFFVEGWEPQANVLGGDAKRIVARLKTDGVAVWLDNDPSKDPFMPLLLTPAGWQQLADAAARLRTEANAAWERMREPVDRSRERGNG